MAIVTERMNANKPPPAQGDIKSGKLAPGQINNNKDLDVDAKKEEPGFFGSFFANKGKAQAASKKGGSTMEAPPAIIRPQAALSERETLETDVISTFTQTNFFLSR